MTIFWFSKIDGSRIVAILEEDLDRAWKILSDTNNMGIRSTVDINWVLEGETLIGPKTGLIANFDVIKQISLIDPPLR